MLLHALNKGYSRYNFYGTFGIRGPGRGTGHGGYEFKKGFGGEVVQLLGDFVMPVNRPASLLQANAARAACSCRQDGTGKIAGARKPAEDKSGGRH